MADLDLVPFAGYISDESGFYGSVELRKNLDTRSQKISNKQLVQRWNKDQAAYPAAVSVTTTPAEPVIHYNRLEGVTTARQLTETVDEFVKRLPPRTTFMKPWIWITCPIVNGKGKIAAFRHNLEQEESPEQMTNRAHALLSQFAAEKERITSANPNSTQSTITRKLGSLREQLKEDILDIAVASGMTNGKWMLFPKPEDVNRVWKLVAEAVVDGRLGDTAKIAPADPPDPSVQKKKQTSHLICVYTRDFSDLDDGRRVLEELIELGLAPRNAADGAIYYKADAYTYLNIDSSNPYGLKASLYSSKDIASLSKTENQPKRKQQTLTTMLGGRKKRKT
ncbi:unnamed protein product [Aureobasidium vineae]|uniref:DUF1917-domain-containing protein n=1 Tax=Aureobasidium vineae TaxID=2773715 RepID=A0A9N8JA09_9PEZI|nr:unnamed protein product [Aureobasidium vineae]